MKLGVMCSGNGTNFENILRTCWNDEVVLMIHNKEKCGAVKRAQQFGVPHCYISHKKEEDMIKFHPSLLPKYKGLNAVEQALESGDKKTGCTVHYVNDELDGGEIILQSEVDILPHDNVKTLTKAIQRKEYAALPVAIEHVKQRFETPLVRDSVSC